ncbi:AMP-binding enzyme [Pseudovirgaria hyperparasitica]|uniref:AMP-binding enzyme n=1 Tax=Pseudovirgaria hyperparasitica TaxID=470096 RepID=A0A6A6WE05_9PEZI|nr:AMP-binding enzyme [Pseudovirgaria hyperparasitica]KAF2760795.1 AMP-binding enzyme [Pseudovirgaria hyperparasitica]
MPVISRDPGSRLLVTTLHDIAQYDPSRAWASVPIDDNDLAKGFRDVTYKSLLNAVSHATHWLQAHIQLEDVFETLAYAGPKDLRYPILALAVAHIRAKLLLPSPFVAKSALSHLVRSSHCKIFLHDATFHSLVSEAVELSGNGAVILQVPQLESWLQDEPATPVFWDRSWDQAKNDPWMIFHTSGTTGVPRLVTYTHEMMTSLDAAELMDDAKGAAVSNQHYRDRRWYTPLPALHFVGMTIALQFTFFMNGVLVVGPTTPGPASPELVSEILRHGHVQCAMMPPSLITDIAATPTGLKALGSLDFLYFAGAPMNVETGRKLQNHVKVKPAMGSTEAGAYFLGVDDDEDWEWFSFRPGMGMEFRPVSGNLYEAVFVQRPELQRWQQVFKLYPELQEFPTKDLFISHPDRPGRWKCAGRTDDLIVFAHGKSLVASDLEAQIASHPNVAGVLVGGSNRMRPFLLVQWRGEDGTDEMERIRLLWPTIQKTNDTCSELVRLTRGLVLFTKPGRDLIRTTKGEISRKLNEKAYEAELSKRYALEI